MQKFASDENIDRHDPMKHSLPKDFTGNYQKLVTFKKRFGHCRVPGNWTEDRALASWLDRQRRQWERLPMEALARLFSLGVRFGYRPDQWIARIVDLLAFRTKHGHASVSHGDPMYRDLAKWCTRQRENRRELSPGQIRLMGEIGFVWDPLRARHLARLKELQDFQRRFGHCDVPIQPGHTQLASWVFNIRSTQRPSPAWLRRELDKMGFDYRPVLERQWEERFAEAKRFQEKHGHLRVPPRTGLSMWIHGQRSKPMLVSKERRKRLEEIGFDWDPLETAWNRQLADLERFHRKYGHCNVPTSYAENPQLSMWVHNTRKKADKLSPERRQRLNALGFAWRLKKQREQHSWDWWYEKLVEFHRRHGHCQVSEARGPDIALGAWVTRMRLYRSQLSKARKHLLDEIGFSWNPNESKWGRKFRELAEFKVEHGHCNVPHGYPENPSLALWLNKQRGRHARGKLFPDREQMLVALGVVWDTIKEQWTQRLTELRAFRQRFGHCEVPVTWKENPKLGKWVSRQREWKDRLSPEKIKCFNDLGFTWRIERNRKAP